MVKISQFLVLIVLLISQIDVRLADDEESTTGGEAGGEATTKAGKTDDGKHDGFSNADLQKKYEKIKNNKNSNPLKGKSGKIMQIVIEAIKEINPVRLVQGFDPDVLIDLNGLDMEKLKLPVNYLSDSFFTKITVRMKKSKKDLSKELGVDIEAKKEGEWLSVGHMLKVGKKFNLKLGDYLDALGMDLKPYEKKYDDSLIETVRVPVEFIDEISTEGFTKYINIIKEYVNTNGGPINSALKAYGDATGKDVVAETQKAIIKLKTFNVTTTNSSYNADFAKYQKQMNEVKGEFLKQVQHQYNDWFGRGGRFYVYQARLSQFVDDLGKKAVSVSDSDPFQRFIASIGNLLGAQARAIVYIIYQPNVVMFNQVYGPFLLIPRILLFSDGDIWEKILALPPVIIQSTGGAFKPTMIVVEPFLRLFRFLLTGEYTNSLSCGLDVSASYGISIWGGSFKPKSKSAEKQPDPTPPKQSEPKKRTKRQAPKGKGDKKSDKKEISPEEAAKYTRNDKKLADTYQGGPPPGGYKLGVKSNGSIDLDDEDMISRVLLSPDFILKAGGPVFVPFASVLAPSLRVVNTLLFGKDDFNKRMTEVPEIIRGVGLIGPLADVVQSLLPLVKLGYLGYNGQLKSSDIIVQAPSLAKQLTNGVLYNIYKDPSKLMGAMLIFLEGHGGLLAMLKLQATANVPMTDPGATTMSKKDLGPEADFVEKYLGYFFGGTFLHYFQAVSPVVSLNSALFNGILGNIIDPAKFLDTNINLKSQPLKNLIEAFDDLPRMFKSAADKKSFLMAVLGGQDPDVLNEIGISAEKLVESGIDPGLLLAGGKKLVDEKHRKKLEDESNLVNIGINLKLMAKMELDTKAFLENGFLDVKEEKLKEVGIDFNSLLNRVLRGSIEDDLRLANSGIDLKAMLRAGICPAKLLVGGVHALPEEKVKALGIKNPNELTDEDIKALGFNPIKLHSKGINAKKLVQEGIETQMQQQANMGLNVYNLVLSVMTGLEHHRLLKGGIDLKAMLRAGIDTKLLLTGGLKKELKGNVSPDSLQKIGINHKQIISMGINVNLVVDIGASVLNPINLVKMGIDPMSTLIFTLSRHGLDTMTGGVSDPIAITFGFLNSVLRIINNIIGLVPKIRELPGGKSIVGPDGRFVGWAGFIAYNIIGLENTDGLIGFFQKALNGKFTLAEIMNLVNPIRITNEIAHPDKKPVIRRRVKDNRQSVEQYVVRSQNMRVGQSRKSAIYAKNKEGKDDDSYHDESKLLPTESPDEAPATATTSKGRLNLDPRSFG